MNSKDIGKLYEDRAVQFLLNKGYIIVGRNIRYKKIEIDILCKYENKFIVVEVKYRSSFHFLHISPQQIHRIANYMEYFYPEEFYQIDLVLCDRTNIEHVINIQIN